jgi:hypothetical protein
MKILNLIMVAGAFFSASFALAQEVSYRGSLLEVERSWENQQVGLLNYVPQGNLASELGCFPTGDQAGSTYMFNNRFQGTLAPGESIQIQFKVCDGGGFQPFTQSSIAYEFINKRIKLSGYSIDPDGVRREMYHPLTTLPYKTLWGGVGPSEGKYGTWTYVLSNPTRYPIKVLNASFIVVSY